MDKMGEADKRIYVHDALFSKADHPWLQGIEAALKRDIKVDLILADPKSDIYKKRRSLIEPTLPNKWPKQFFEWPEQLRNLLLTYPDQFKVRSTLEKSKQDNDLFGGPFVWIYPKDLFMGYFAPGIQSDRAPFIVLSNSHSTKYFFDKLEEWIESRTDVSEEVRQ